MSRNNNFYNKIQNSGLSMYAVSKMSGVPYTTVNRLVRGSLDINKCSYDTVAHLAACLGCNIENIVNSVQIMRNVSGIYRGIQYRFEQSGNMVKVLVMYGGKEYLVTEEKGLTKISMHRAYVAIAECYIDIFLKEKEAERLL